LADKEAPAVLEVTVQVVRPVLLEVQVAQAVQVGLEVKPMQEGLLVLVRSLPEPAVTCLIIQLVMKLLQQEELQELPDQQAHLAVVDQAVRVAPLAPLAQVPRGALHTQED